VTIEDCGHVPQVERPDETNELLMRFIARNEISVARPRTPRPQSGGDRTGRQAA
jgi:hypothetical protein